VGKKYKGPLCVYCNKQTASTADHVFAREFFLVCDRASLPKAPACAKCNNMKSALEHYAATVLPFGARHSTGTANLTQMVPKRLARNAALHRKLSAEAGTTWSVESGLYVPVTTIPIDARKLETLFALIAKGLAWHHWHVQFSNEHFVNAMLLTEGGEHFFENRYFALNARARVNADLGRGTFVYEGVQGVDCPALTVWRIAVYGGVKLGGDETAPGQISSIVGVITGPKSATRGLPSPRA
jgi:hypothetical protein